jgi:hypothetical protein
MSRIDRIQSSMLREQVTMSYDGRTLLGDVRDAFLDAYGTIRLRVTHFNGEPWPIDPPATSVEVIGS